MRETSSSTPQLAEAKTGKASNGSLGPRGNVLPPRADNARPRLGGTLPQIVSLALLSAVGAELLAAYADNTGRPGALLFALIFFAALYGAPALLARELTRRAGWGWPSLLLLTLALGVAQACLIDRSLFSEDYGGYDGWARDRRVGYIGVLSIGARQAIDILIGHVIFSFSAPIAVAEAWRPVSAGQPWLGRVGIAAALVAYLGAALLIIFDPATQDLTRLQIIASFVVIVTLLLLAWFAGRQHCAERPAPDRSSKRPIIVFAIAIVPAMIMAGDLFGESGSGFAFTLVAVSVMCLLLGWRARRAGWGVADTAAVALALLVSRGVLAFTYFPLAGQVLPAAKYAHNVVMLSLVLLAGWFALHRAKPRPNRLNP